MITKVMYGAMALASAFRSTYLQRYYDHGQSKDDALKRKLSIIRKIHLIGALMFVLGFILWNVDNIFCQHLREARRRAGMSTFISEGDVDFGV